MFKIIKYIIPVRLKLSILDFFSHNEYIVDKIVSRINYNNNKYCGLTADKAIQKLIHDFEFKSVLDVGSGEGRHSQIFMDAGKHVTSLDYGDSVYFERCSDKNSVVRCDYYKFQCEEKFDCIWASHILEHQVNPNAFLKRIYDDLLPGGIVAITVPPLKPQIVGGHVNLYNAGLLLYQMVLAGFDCKYASVLTYGYNISVIVKKPIVPIDLSFISYDSGDINKLSIYFPDVIVDEINGKDVFHGDIPSINW